MTIVCLNSHCYFGGCALTGMHWEIIIVRDLLDSIERFFRFFFRIIALNTHFVGTLDLVVSQKVRSRLGLGWLTFFLGRIYKWLIQEDQRILLEFWRCFWRQNKQCCHFRILENWLVIMIGFYCPLNLFSLFQLLSIQLFCLIPDHSIWKSWLIWLLCSH